MQRSWTPFCLVPGVKGYPPSHCVHLPGCSRPPRPSADRSARFHRRQSRRNPKRMRWAQGERVSSVKGAPGRRGTCGPRSPTYSPVDAAFCHFERAFVLRYSSLSLSFPPFAKTSPSFLFAVLSSSGLFLSLSVARLVSTLPSPSLPVPVPLHERKVTLKVCRCQ